MKIPKKLNILEQTWNVVWGKLESGTGRVVLQDKVFVLHIDTDESTQAETLLHLIIATVLTFCGMPEELKDEDEIDQFAVQFAQLLFTIFRRNDLVLGTPLEPLPSKLSILEQQWSVGWGRMDDAMGKTFIYRHHIVINNDLPEDCTTETLLHEILHAVINTAGLHTRFKKDEENAEEQLVAQVSPLLFAIIRRNKLDFTDTTDPFAPPSKTKPRKKPRRKS